MEAVIQFQDPDGKFSTVREKTPRQEHSPDSESEHPTLHAVILHNDNVNGFEYVVGVLQRVFGYGQLKAFWLTLKAHVNGRCNVWQGAKPEAETKADEIRGCGPDPKKPRALPLQVSLLPLA